MDMHRLSPDSERFALSLLPKNINGGSITLDAFYFICGIAKLDGATNGTALYDAFDKYYTAFSYEHLQPYEYCKKS